MRISDWSSDVCSSDLVDAELRAAAAPHPDAAAVPAPVLALHAARLGQLPDDVDPAPDRDVAAALAAVVRLAAHRLPVVVVAGTVAVAGARSEEHTSELQSLMRISYSVFCLIKKNTPIHHHLHL